MLQKMERNMKQKKNQVKKYQGKAQRKRSNPYTKNLKRRNILVKMGNQQKQNQVKKNLKNQKKDQENQNLKSLKQEKLLAKMVK